MQGKLIAELGKFASRLYDVRVALYGPEVAAELVEILSRHNGAAPENSKPIEGYGDKYLVTRSGVIYSKRNNGGYYPLTPCKNNRGYLHIGLHKNGKRITRAIHRVIAAVFVPNVQGLNDVNHIDGDKHNNRADNLEWSNDSLNVSHAFKMGLLKPLKGEDNPRASLNDWEVLKIRESAKENPKGYTTRLSKFYGVSPQIICNIVNRKTWRHI